MGLRGPGAKALRRKKPDPPAAEEGQKHPWERARPVAG